MNWYSIFYWLTVANNARAFFITFVVIFTLVFVIAMIISFISLSEGDDSTHKASKPWIWYSTPFMIVFWALTVFTPNKSDTLLIIAGGAVGNFITSDSSSRAIPADISSFLHIKLQEEIASSTDELKKTLGAQTPKEKFIDKAKDLTKEEIIELLQNDTTVLHH